jgi:hypothetical protein
MAAIRGAERERGADNFTMRQCGREMRGGTSPQRLIVITLGFAAKKTFVFFVPSW